MSSSVRRRGEKEPGPATTNPPASERKRGPRIDTSTRGAPAAGTNKDGSGAGEPIPRSPSQRILAGFKTVRTAARRKSDATIRWIVSLWPLVADYEPTMFRVSVFVLIALAAHWLWTGRLVSSSVYAMIIGSWFLYVVAQTLIVVGSVYIARRWVFVPLYNLKTKKGQPPSAKLVMVRSRESKRAASKRACVPRKPPQVFRWDFVGVAASAVFGKIASLQIPRPLRPIVYGAWAKLYGVNTEEMGQPISAYPSLQEFFTRSLAPGARPIDDTVPLVSPVDGKVTICGEITSDRVEQVKGVTYSLRQFLGREHAWLTNPVEDPSVAAAAGGDGGFYGADAEVDGEGSVGGSRDGHVSSDSSVLSDDEGDNADGSRSDGGLDLGSLLGGLAAGSDTASVLSETEDVVMLNEEVFAPPNLRDADGRRAGDPSAFVENAANKLFHCVLYLAPGDYHRFHSPADATFSAIRHFPGTLFPISPLVARLIPSLFALNERVVMEGSWPYGSFHYVAVGAYNVGSVLINMDSELRTNRVNRDWRNPNLELFSWGGVGCFAYDRKLTPPVDAAKGEEIGRFQLGSTIVLIFEAPADFEFSIKPGDTVRVGQPIGALGRGD